jgi:CspA family cold shock protein
MPSGTVKWFSPARGFGFIRPDDGSNDVFVHISALERSDLEQLLEGQKVQFEVERGQNGKLAATNLKGE